MDIEELKKNVSILDVASRYTKINRKGKGICPIHEEDTPSFTIYPDTNTFHCFGCGANGDIIDLVSKVENVPFLDALKKIGGNNYTQQSNKKIIIEKEKKRFEYNKRSNEQAKYIYNDEQGKPIYIKIRTNDKKFFYYENVNGKYMSNLVDVRATLYRLPKILEAETVYIVEGEKDVETLEKQGLTATTSGGGTTWKKEFNKYFENKNVIVIPDCDNAGKNYSESIRKNVSQISKSFKVIDLGLSDGQDVTDYLETHTKEELMELINSDSFDIDNLKKSDFMEATLYNYILDMNPEQRMLTKMKVQEVAKEFKILRDFNKLFGFYENQRIQKAKSEGSGLVEFTDIAEVIKGDIFCGDWIATDEGIHRIVIKENQTLKIYACPHPILPILRLKNMDTEREKIRLAFKKDGKWHTITVDKSTISNIRSIIMLSDIGVEVNSNNAKELITYLADVINLNVSTISKKESLSRLGWVNNNLFCPYDDVEFDGENQYKYLYEAVASKGDLSDWVDFIKPLRSEKLVRLMLASSFASPLIEKVNALPFVFHLWGGTGTGKTVALMVAMSIWGNPSMGKLTRTLNMTQNSMMSTAAFLNNLPFGADELQAIKSRFENYDTLIMKLTEGIDRGRMTYDKVNEIKSWACSFLFTGEEPCTKTGSGGGVKNRVLEAECEGRLIQNGNKTVNFIKENYGEVGKKYIEIIKTIDIISEYEQLLKEVISIHDTTDKQAMAISLVLLADRITSLYIFNDEPLNIQDLDGFLLKDDEVSTSERAFEYIKSVIAQNFIKFREIGDIESWGTISGGNIFFNKNVLTRELEKEGFDFEAVKKKWANNSYIERNSQEKFVHQRKVNGISVSFIKIPTEEITVDDENLPF